MTLFSDSAPLHPDAEMLATYLQDAREVVAGLEEGAVDLWLPDTQSQALSHLWLLAHRLQGTAGLYGHPQTAALAGLLERLLQGRSTLPENAVSLVSDLIERACTCFHQSLALLAAGQAEGNVGLAFAGLGGPAPLLRMLREHPQVRAERPVPQVSEEVAAREHFAHANADIWEDFGPEASDLITVLESGFDATKGGDPPGSGADLASLFRAAHTLKGSSAMIGLSSLADTGHAMEDLLASVREDGMTLERALPLLREGLLTAKDVLAHAEGLLEAEPKARIAALRSNVAALLGGQAAAPLSPTPQAPVAASTRLSIRVDSEQLDAMLGNVAGLVAARSRLSSFGGRQQALGVSLDDAHIRVQGTIRDFEERYLNPDLMPQGAGQGSGAVNPAANPVGPSSQMTGELDDRLSDFGALELDTYTDLNILARAVTELSADLSEIRAQSAEARSVFAEELTALEKLIRQLRADLSRARLLPLTRVVAPLGRWAERREDLELHVTGQGSSIDAQQAGPLGEALLHLLTNAAVHGQQGPEARRASGKPEQLQIHLDLRLSGGSLDVSVRDDGAGLNLGALKERALASGHLSAAELANATPAQLAELVFLPGLSTAQQLTQEAGRGVGMDAVRAAIGRLGGRVSLSSLPGQGTTIHLRIPLSQQIADVLLIQVGAQQVGVLASQVLNLVAVTEPPAGAVDLSTLWNEAPAPGERYAATLSLPGASAEQTLTILADRFLNIEEVVLRPAGALLGALGYLGALTTINDAAGRAVAVPVLDPVGLAALQGQPPRPRRATPAAPVNARILLVDDSLSVRRHVSRSLERAGFTVLTASDGQEALERLLSGEVAELVLTDLEMPRLNGFELIRALRASPVTSRLPIVVMSTRAGEKHQRLALDLGADDYLAKPTGERVLVRQLSALLSTALASATPASTDTTVGAASTAGHG
jgi:chemosensory pili system protein ChpA (sensor histidine kinase/response regulator)